MDRTSTGTEPAKALHYNPNAFWRGYIFVIFAIAAAAIGVVDWVSQDAVARHCIGRGCLFQWIPQPWRFVVILTVAGAFLAFGIVMSLRLERRAVMARLDSSGITITGLLRPLSIAWNDVKSISNTGKAFLISGTSTRGRATTLQLAFLMLDHSPEEVASALAGHRPDLVARPPRAPSAAAGTGALTG